MDKDRKCRVPQEVIVSKFFGVVRRVTRSKESPKKDYTCQICDRAIDEATALTHIKAEEYLLELIRKDHPEWKENEKTCHKCVEYYKELIKKAKI